MKSPRICTVVTGKSLDEFIINLDKTQAFSDLVELRVDYIHGFSLGDLEVVREHTKKDAIFCCRVKMEGGLYEGSEKKRKEIIEKAGGMGFAYVDVELGSARQFDLARLSVTQMILSFHDFEGTPSLGKLNQIKQEMKLLPSVVMKFATLVNGDEDIRVLWKFLLEKEKGEKMVVLGMGDKGKVVRVLGPILGSEFTFAKTEYSESAGGQIDSKLLRGMYNDLS